jgi:hypothetical protein
MCGLKTVQVPNTCESFHSKFNASVSCGHPNIFQFIERSIEEFSDR